MRIPSRVVLPFGYRISVRQLSDSEMDRRDPNADGIWDDELKTIYLRKRLPVTRRRYILAHKLGHAWLDWQHRHLDNAKAKTSQEQSHSAHSSFLAACEFHNPPPFCLGHGLHR